MGKKYKSFCNDFCYKRQRKNNCKICKIEICNTCTFPSINKNKKFDLCIDCASDKVFKNIDKNGLEK